MDNQHILVVEDDPSLAEWIEEYLCNHHYRVSLISTGGQAVEQIRELKPDLVVLDIMLPEKNGFDICKEARDFYPCPILMMTACDEESDEVLSLELGADDYLTKPVRPRALLARIQALLRRSQHVSSLDRIDVYDLTIEKTNKTVKRQSNAINISSNEFDVLWLLAAQKDQLVSRADLVSQLRGFDYDGFDRSIDIRISRLRKKLSEANSEVHIKSVWGKGYCLTANP